MNGGVPGRQQRDRYGRCKAREIFWQSQIIKILGGVSRGDDERCSDKGMLN